MDLGLKDSVALVTGGSYGIGRACAEALAGEGARIALCARNKEKVERAAGEIQSKFGVKAIGVAADVANKDDIEKFVNRAAEIFGTINVLINNAGMGSNEKIETTPDDTWQRYWEMNTMSAIRCSRAVIPHMKKNNWGRIVNVSSVFAKQPGSFCPVYNVTKAALMMYSKCLADELVEYNILVNNVNPGFTRTPLWEASAAELGKEQGITGDRFMDDLADRETTIKRFCRVEELAHCILLLCSAKNGYMVGASIDVHGGLLKGMY